VHHELDSNETRTRCCHNTKSLISEDRQWGGTDILAHGLVAHFAVGSGGDKTGLGCWTWSRFLGKNGMHLQCVSFYQPTPNKVGPSSVWSQHRAYFQLRDDDRDPCLAFYEDLHGEVLTWLAAGDQIIIGGDLNSHVLKPTVSLFFSQLGLHNLIFQRHSPIGATTTLARNEQHKILDSFWGMATSRWPGVGTVIPRRFPLQAILLCGWISRIPAPLATTPRLPTLSKPVDSAWTAPKL